MKYIARHYMLATLWYLLSIIGILIITIITRNIIVSSLIILITPKFIGIYYDKLKKANKEKKFKLLNDKFHELKDKENPTMYEKLFVNSYNDLAIGILREVINKNEIKYIHNIDFDVIYDKDFIIFNFEYNYHQIYYYVYEDKVIYYIDSPRKYDHLECNNEYEKPYMLDLCINNYNNLESFFNSLIPNIKSNINSVDEFEENINIVNINPKTLADIEDLKGFIKEMRIHILIWSSLYCIIAIILTYFGITDIIMVNNSSFYQLFLLIICLVFIDGLGIASVICCIYYFRFARVLDNDMKHQIVDTICAKPYKVKFMVQSVGYRNSSMRFCSGIYLYFNEGKKLKLTFAHYFSVPSKKHKKAINNEFIKKQLDIKYYKNSKVIISGLESYRKSIIDKKRNLN